MSDRFIHNLGPALMEQVGALAFRNGVTKGEVTRHAVRLYLALEEAVSQGGYILADMTRPVSDIAHTVVSRFLTI